MMLWKGRSQAESDISLRSTVIAGSFISRCGLVASEHVLFVHMHMLAHILGAVEARRVVYGNSY